jgi:uncharacterized oxidoreductase
VARITASSLHRLVCSIFKSAGSEPREAGLIADQLVDANLCGHDSHGVIRIPGYIEQMRAKRLLPNKRAKIVANFGATTILDGQLGFGQVIGHEAMTIGIEASAEHGVALVGTRNSGHLGRIGYWAEIAAMAGRASLHFISAASPGGAQVAAFGGRDRRMAANPMAMGMPVKDQPPIILDFATSATAVGKVRVAQNRGEKLPQACIVDADGHLTDDPKALFGDKPGAIIPFGGHKGFALNVFNDIFGGALTGAGIPHKGERSSVQSGNNMLSIFIAPDRFLDVEGMAAQLKEYIEWLAASEPMEAGQKVRVPGVGVAMERDRRKAQGIELEELTWKAIVAAGEQVGLKRDDLQ